MRLGNKLIDNVLGSTGFSVEGHLFRRGGAKVNQSSGSFHNTTPNGDLKGTIGLPLGFLKRREDTRLEAQAIRFTDRYGYIETLGK
ncbi:MAG: hypothetical protein Nk1A_6900 [Endomicrobiia bacterium]|nr:MAG: hypothetical protein Nk1A_6900 [Endomicrobiia bacterium]